MRARISVFELKYSKQMPLLKTHPTLTWYLRNLGLQLKNNPLTEKEGAMLNYTCSRPK